MTRSDIGVIKMMTSPPQKIVNDGYRIINLADGCVYEFDTEKVKWMKKEKATRQDYKEGLAQI